MLEIENPHSHKNLRHAEFISPLVTDVPASILRIITVVRDDRWTLNQVQGDDIRTLPAIESDILQRINVTGTEIK